MQGESMDRRADNRSGGDDERIFAPLPGEQSKSTVATGSLPNSVGLPFTNGPRGFFLRTILAGAQQTDPPIHPWGECGDREARIKTISRLAGTTFRVSRPSTVQTAVPPSVFSNIGRAFSDSITKKLAWEDADEVHCPGFDARRRCRTPGGWMRSGGREKRALACSLQASLWRGFRMGWAAGSRSLLVFVGLSLAAATHAFAVDGSDIIDTLAGGGNGDGFPATIASTAPDGVSVGPDGSIYIAESTEHRIRRIDPQSGFIETIAGIGSQGFAGDGGQALLARLSYPTSAVADAVGNLYICDQSNQRIRRVSPNGIITTVAGSGVAGYADGPAGSAKLYLPRSISIDASGNILIAEPYNQRVRYLTVATGTVSTVA